MRKLLIWPALALGTFMPAYGGPITVSLGDAGSFGLLGGTISNTGTSVVTGNVGATTTITGFPPGTATGTVFGFPSDPSVEAAYTAFENAFTSAQGLTSTQTFSTNLTADTVFAANSVNTFTNTSVSTTSGITLTFDGGGNSNAVFIIEVGQAFTVNGALTFVLENGAQADNIFWIVGTEATISVGTSGPITFDGNILAGDTFTMSASGSPGGSGVLAGTINGCVFAENANTLAGETDVNGCVGTTAGVPEPGSAGLVGLGGLVGILAWRRLRHRAATSEA